MTPVPAPNIPLNGIAGTAGGVSNDTSRLASKDNLDKAGQRFEAIFTGMMLKSMRAAKLGDGLFDNKAGEQFRDMFDTRIAEDMAVSTPLGIGKAMTAFLAQAQAVPATPAAGGDAPADGTGKTP